MSQRTKVVGGRTPMIWLFIVITVFAVIVLAAGAYLVSKSQGQQAIEQHYQAGVAFENVEDWPAAEAEYKSAISLDAGYKDVQARLAEVKTRQAEVYASATAVAIAEAETAHAAATSTALAAQATAVAAPIITAEALEARYQHALGLINLQQWTVAQQELQTIFDTDPNYKEVQAQLALVHSELSKLTPTVTPTPLTPPTPTITPTPVHRTLEVVSDIGHPVSTNQTGPFDLEATGAYQSADVWAEIEGATRIWYGEYQSGPLYFRRMIAMPENALAVYGSIQITADNYFNLWLNGVDYGGTAPPDSGQYKNVYEFTLAALRPGQNELLIEAREYSAGTPSMLVYSAKITYLQP